MTDYAYKLTKKIDKIHDFAREKLKISANSMKRNYNVNLKLIEYERGDAVWLHNTRHDGLTSKLACHWEGPYTVLQKINDFVYKIQKNQRTKPRVVHHNHLKPYLGHDKPDWLK